MKKLFLVLFVFFVVPFFSEPFATHAFEVIPTVAMLVDKKWVSFSLFKCLQNTLGLSRAKWWVLDQCHNQRNLAEYEGHLDINPQLLKELITLTQELLHLVKELPDIN